MVQEFQVVRCFSCETFQVQQVKKAKKWHCKMCGEKQSVIKEFGRGSGADCRRHVQKLNGLRGQLLEEQNENVWSQWEENEEDVTIHEDQTLCNEVQQSPGESRWSKYVTTVTTPEEDEDENNVEVNIHTDSKHFGYRGNVRKRRRGRGGRRGFGSCGENEGDDDEEKEQHGCTIRHSRGRKRAFSRAGSPPTSWEEPPFPAPSFHSNTHTPPTSWEEPSLPAPSFHSNNPTPSATGKSPPYGTPSRNFFGFPPKPNVSIQSGGIKTIDPATQNPLRNHVSTSKANSILQPFSKTNQSQSKTSKWDRFLTAPATEDQEEEDEGEVGYVDFQWKGQHSEAVTCHSQSTGFCQTQDSTGGFLNSFEDSKVKRERNCATSALLGTSPGLVTNSCVPGWGKSATACLGFGSLANQIARPTVSAVPIGQESPVCVQPPPTKRPCPGLAAGSLFQTDEDFDVLF